MKLFQSYQKSLTILIFSCFFFLYGCTSHFIVDNTTHNKIVVNESSNTEFINVYVKDVEKDVTFESIIYNRTKLDVSVETLENGMTEITAVKQNGGPVIIGKEQPMVDEPNQLVYTVNGKKQKVQLNEIEYLPTKLGK